MIGWVAAESKTGGREVPSVDGHFEAASDVYRL